MKKVYGSKALTLAVLILMVVAAVPSLHAQTFYSVPPSRAVRMASSAV